MHIHSDTLLSEFTHAMLEQVNTSLRAQLGSELAVNSGGQAHLVRDAALLPLPPEMTWGRLWTLAATQTFQPTLSTTH
jgi:hypothetical protein